MIGERKIRLNGKEVSLRFNWGAITKFCKQTGLGLSSLKESLDEPDNLTTLLIHLANQGGDKLKRSDVENCSFWEVSTALEAVGELMEEAAPKEGGKVAGEK